MKRTSTSATTQNLKTLTEEDIQKLDDLYVANLTAGIIHWREDVSYGYYGMTRWKWTGPPVSELVDWGSVNSFSTARAMILARINRSNSAEYMGTGEGVTAAHSPDITADQARLQMRS